MLNWCRLIIWFHDHLPFMTIYCPTVSITWRMLKLCENCSNIDIVWDKFGFENSHGNRNFGFDLLASVRFGSGFKNRNWTEIRFPHIHRQNWTHFVFSITYHRTNCTIFVVLCRSVHCFQGSALDCKAMDSHVITVRRQWWRSGDICWSGIICD